MPAVKTKDSEINADEEIHVTESFLAIDGVTVPRFLYGTAWKEDDTRRLAELAIASGFRGIDTANQRRHYHEAGVGEAIQAAMARGVVHREDLFLQTKFTFQRGQDHRLPYDASSPVEIQVEQSLASSLAHLGVATIDSYLLHGPTQRAGLAADDWAAWRAMEKLHDGGQVRFLGVSNVTLEQLQLFCRGARVPPQFVQNRCYASRGWDRKVRQFCVANGVTYQGFSLLTANSHALAHPALSRIARRHARAENQIIFRFALEAGMIPLTGTTSAAHMRADLEIFDFHLERDEVEQIERITDK